MSDPLSEKARALAVTFGSYLYDRGVLIHSGDEQKLTELIEAALREAAEEAYKRDVNDGKTEQHASDFYGW